MGGRSHFLSNVSEGEPARLDDARDTVEGLSPNERLLVEDASHTLSAGVEVLNDARSGPSNPLAACPEIADTGVSDSRE